MLESPLKSLLKILTHKVFIYFESTEVKFTNMFTFVHYIYKMKREYSSTIIIISAQFISCWKIFYKVDYISTALKKKFTASGIISVT